jgi:hypothetical protein
MFERALPAGTHSVLTKNLAEKDIFNLCSRRFRWPAEIVGQNEAMIQRSKRSRLQGCTKVKAVKPLSRTRLLGRALAACGQGALAFKV